MKTDVTNISGHLDPVLLKEVKNIPSKMSFKISEVARMLNIKPHVLRYWEMEFDVFHPEKMPNGQRLFFKKDVETALFIKKLLYRDGFSVRGAKKVLRDLRRENRAYRKKSVQNEGLLKDIEVINTIISDVRDLIT